MPEQTLQPATPAEPASSIHPGPSPEKSIRPPRRYRSQRRWITLALLLALSLWAYRYLTVRRIIPSSGGLYFFKQIAVPGLHQGDPQWRDERLGHSTDSIGATGCAITSAAMILKWHGVDTDPHRLNAYLTTHAGYVGNGYLVWEKAAKLANNLKKAYEDAPSYWRIDSQLIKGNPVIVRIHFPSGGTHFVVIAGKSGFNYLIMDPGAGWQRGLYPLSDIVPRIDALRYYRLSKHPTSPMGRPSRIIEVTINPSPTPK